MAMNNNYCPRIATKCRDSRVADVYHEEECVFKSRLTNVSCNSPENVRVGVIFREYDGEDFSRYLKDDDDKEVLPTVTSPVERTTKQSSGGRYRRQGSRMAEAEDVTLPGGPLQKETAIIISNSPMPVSSSGGFSRRKSADGLKERLGQLLPRTSRRPRSTSRPRSIQDYSYTDLKAGSGSLAVIEQHDDAASDGRSSLFLETRSDLGGYSKRKTTTSWPQSSDDAPSSERNAVLGAADRASVVVAKSRSDGRTIRGGGFRRRAKSVPDLLDTESIVSSAGLRRDDRRRCGAPAAAAAAGTTGPFSCWDDDFGRQAKQSSDGGNARTQQQSLWKRVAQTFSVHRRKNGRSGGRGTKAGQSCPQGNETPLSVKLLQHPPEKKRSLPLAPTPYDTTTISSNFYDEIKL